MEFGFNQTAYTTNDLRAICQDLAYTGRELLSHGITDAYMRHEELCKL